MSRIVEFLQTVDWNSPPAVVVIVLLSILAMMRRWFLLGMCLLVVTLGRGLCYLQLNRELLQDSSLTLATVIYISGGIILASLAAVEFFVRE